MDRRTVPLSVDMERRRRMGGNQKLKDELNISIHVRVPAQKAAGLIVELKTHNIAAVDISRTLDTLRLQGKEIPERKNKDIATLFASAPAQYARSLIKQLREQGYEANYAGMPERKKTIEWMDDWRKYCEEREPVLQHREHPEGLSRLLGAVRKEGQGRKRNPPLRGL